MRQFKVAALWFILLFDVGTGQNEIWEHKGGYDGYAPALVEVAQLLLRDMIERRRMEAPLATDQKDPLGLEEPETNARSSRHQMTNIIEGQIITRQNERDDSDMLQAMQACTNVEPVDIDGEEIEAVADEAHEHPRTTKKSTSIWKTTWTVVKNWLHF